VVHYNYIAIEGNIGAGKTTLAEILADRYNARLILEEFEENSFLPKFYKEPDKYAFPLEMSFLAERYQQLKDQLAKQDLFQSLTVSDYFIDKSLIFAKNNLDSDEYKLYSNLFRIIIATLPRPELIIYLFQTEDRLLTNIDKRGRSYETYIRKEYLQDIQAGYFAHLKTLQKERILIINTENIDFVENPQDLDKIIEIAERKYIPGLYRFDL
jgi:deoxyadenosine/deoxycytidine kinase